MNEMTFEAIHEAKHMLLNAFEFLLELSWRMLGNYPILRATKDSPIGFLRVVQSGIAFR